jgi:phosphoglycolate phosphatase
VRLVLPACVLFDLDGTLLDSWPGIAFSIDQALCTVGLPPISGLRSLLGPPIRTIFSRAVPTDDVALLDRLEAAFRISYDAEGWKKTVCFSGTLEALAAMKAVGRRLFVISNKPRHISLKILERERLFPLFERIYTRDSRVPPYASKEEMLREFLRDTGITSSDCVMVGDTMEDITAAAANGITAILMEHGYGAVAASVPVRMRMRSFLEFLPRKTMEKM